MSALLLPLTSSVRSFHSFIALTEKTSFPIWAFPLAVAFWIYSVRLTCSSKFRQLSVIRPKSFAEISVFSSCLACTTFTISSNHGKYTILRAVISWGHNGKDTNRARANRSAGSIFCLNELLYSNLL